MIYSVWDWDKLTYQYYEGSGDLPGTRPSVKKIDEPNASAGRQIETLMPKIPFGAKHIGSGKVAKGRIAASAGDLANRTGGELSPGLSSFSGYGLGANSTDDTSPLITSPWKTLGLWIGATWLGMQVAFWIGSQIEKSYRAQK